jgi:hypothetical protein
MIGQAAIGGSRRYTLIIAISIYGPRPAFVPLKEPDAGLSSFMLRITTIWIATPVAG